MFQQTNGHVSRILQSFDTTISVDDSQDATSINTHLRTLVIAGRGAYATCCIAYDGHIFYVEHPAPYTFEGFVLLAYPEAEVGAYNFVSIKSTNGVTRA